MTFALLATGEELINGDTLNTNSHFLARALNWEGFLLGLHLTCGDGQEEIETCIRFLASRHEILIITGGLGPTSDDRTRYALAKVLELSLVEHHDATSAIKAHIKTYLGSNTVINLNNGDAQQALFPTSAILLPNHYGTAMGCVCNWQGKRVILLPGPPRECIPMFNQYVLPMLQQTKHRSTDWLKWRLFGVAESAIGEQLDEALKGLDCQTGYRLETPYLECKVLCKKSLVDTIKQIVDPIFAPYIIATPYQKAHERLYEKILKLQLPIIIIDDVTAGALQVLIQKPSNYAFLSFHGEGVKSANTLHFHLKGLQSYWLQETHCDATEVSITYSYCDKKGEVTDKLKPFSSVLAVDFAAEWLAYRIFGLIDVLHH